MLQALQLADALAIAEAARRCSRDERAMVDYLGIARKASRPATSPSPFVIPEAIDLAAFESDERRHLARQGRRCERAEANPGEDVDRFHLVLSRAFSENRCD